MVLRPRFSWSWFGASSVSVEEGNLLDFDKRFLLPSSPAEALTWTELLSAESFFFAGVPPPPPVFLLATDKITRVSSFAI